VIRRLAGVVHAAVGFLAGWTAGLVALVFAAVPLWASGAMDQTAAWAVVTLAVSSVGLVWYTRRRCRARREEPWARDAE